MSSVSEFSPLLKVNSPEFSTSKSRGREFNSRRGLNRNSRRRSTQNEFTPAQIFELFEKWCWSLSHNRLKRLSKIISKVKESKYKRTKNKSEGIDRMFSDEELKAFFSALPSEKYCLMFAVQLSLALRISEVVGINQKNVDPYRQTITIHEVKTGRTLDKPLPSTIFARLMAYMAANRKAIQAHEGYLWYSDGHPHKKSNVPHFSKDYARNAFNKARAKAALHPNPDN